MSIHDDAGAWVLGALEEHEAERFRMHLEECDSCRASVAEMQAVVDELPLGAPATSAPPALGARIMREVEAEAALLRAAGPAADRPADRRRWRWRWGPMPAIAVACALGLGVVVGVAGTGGGGETHRVISAQVSYRGAHAVLRQTGPRAQLEVAGMPAPPAGHVYQVWLLPRRGAPAPTSALFSVTRQGAGAVAVPSDLHAVRAVLVTSEPDGGSPHPTAAPVIEVPIPS